MKKMEIGVRGGVKGTRGYKTTEARRQRGKAITDKNGTQEKSSETTKIRQIRTPVCGPRCTLDGRAEKGMADQPNDTLMLGGTTRARQK